MENEQLLELLAQVEQNGGGVVLRVGEAARAVVLSMEAYTSMASGSVDLIGLREPAVLPPTKQTVLVTGGAGYIGGHVTRELLASGYDVVVLDNLYTGRREYVPAEAHFIEGDVRDVNLLRDVFSQHKIDAVVHLAAMLEVAESVEKPLEYFEVNVHGTTRLLEVCSEVGITNVVFSSTAAVYGPQMVMPIPETAACEPINPYGASKLLAEQVLRYFSRYRGMRVTVLRFFNVAGQHVPWGVLDTHEHSHLVPIVLEVATGKRAQLTVNGDDYTTADGTCVRDYVHVLDIAKAHVKALARHSGDQFQVYNVGTGKGVSVREVVQAAAEVTGRMVPMEVGPRRPGDDAMLVADVQAIRSELGFVAEHSDIATIIHSSWQARQ
jgi:UDP-glucose 4-epimerase